MQDEPKATTNGNGFLIIPDAAFGKSYPFASELGRRAWPAGPRKSIEIPLPFAVGIRFLTLKAAIPLGPSFKSKSGNPCLRGKC